MHITINKPTKRGLEIMRDINAGGDSLIHRMREQAAHAKLERDGMIIFVQGNPSRYDLTPLGKAELEIAYGLWVSE